MNFSGGNFARVHEVKLFTFIMVGQVKSLPILSSLTVINILSFIFHDFFNVLSINLDESSKTKRVNSPILRYK